ncbi:YraN family protein [Georgenia sp. Z1344]|uniref:YraN family protein n=1 Tax=Georgenia sp. Z1344 TaxID=3416706 RepID=UPI003CF15AA6
MPDGTGTERDERTTTADAVGAAGTARGAVPGASATGIAPAQDDQAQDDQAPPPSAGRLALGAWGERVAERYLEGLGMVVVERNWRVRDGELDIVAWDPEGRRWTVVEVKTRRSTTFGDPVEAVTADKAARLRRLSRAWVVARATRARPWDPEAGQEAYRGARIGIDVIGVLLTDGAPRITHLRSVA